MLLQALQEGTVTPSKSRESFPGMFVAVCTSNLSDLDNINDPLSDRLTSLHIGFNPRHAENRRIADIARLSPGAYPTYPRSCSTPGSESSTRRGGSRMSDDNPAISAR